VDELLISRAVETWLDDARWAKDAGLTRYLLFLHDFARWEIFDRFLGGEKVAWSVMYVSMWLENPKEDSWSRSVGLPGSLLVKVWDWRQSLLDTFREHMRDPAQLWNLYSQWKSSILFQITLKGARELAKKQLREFRPYFAGEIDPAYKKLAEDFLAKERMRDKCRKLADTTGLNSSEWCSIESSAKYEAESKISSHQDEFDMDYYSFVERRRAEGGDELVAMYLKILDDFLYLL